MQLQLAHSAWIVWLSGITIWAHVSEWMNEQQRDYGGAKAAWTRVQRCLRQVGALGRSFRGDDQIPLWWNWGRGRGGGAAGQYWTWRCWWQLQIRSCGGMQEGERVRLLQRWNVRLSSCAGPFFFCPPPQWRNCLSSQGKRVGGSGVGWRGAQRLPESPWTFTSPPTFWARVTWEWLAR